MKVTIEYNLPEQGQEFEETMNAGKYKCVLSNIMNYLRQKRKYENLESLPIEELEKYIREELEDYNILGEF